LRRFRKFFCFGKEMKSLCRTFAIFKGESLVEEFFEKQHGGSE
jgi:hypothetical protein